MRSVLTASHQPSLYIARLPMVSKYCWVRCSGAAASVMLAVKGVPCIGSCSMPSTRVGSGMPAMSRMVGATSIMWVNCERSPPASLISGRPVHHQRVAGAAEVRADLLAPLERRVAGPRPGRRVVRVHDRAAPGVDAAVALGELELHLVGQRDAVLHGQLVERAGDRALHAGAVVAPDPEDQRVVELAQLLDGVDHAADVVVGVLGEAGVHLHLAGVEGLQVARARRPTPGTPRRAASARRRPG